MALKPKPRVADVALNVVTHYLGAAIPDEKPHMCASEREVRDWFEGAAERDFRFVIAGNDEALMAAIGEPSRLVWVENCQGERQEIKRYLPKW